MEVLALIISLYLSFGNNSQVLSVQPIVKNAKQSDLHYQLSRLNSMDGKLKDKSMQMNSDKKDSVETLKPDPVWKSFKTISGIYRESGHNKEISDYLNKRLQKAGFETYVKTDDIGKHTICALRNVDKSKNNAVILQAHMDMIAISDDNNPLKPIKVQIDNDMLKANNRTLGADDGIGLSIALSIADDPEFKGMPLEIIFTTDEETGMYGARSLEAKDFYGKYLINLDSEKLGEIIVGCAGMYTYSETISVPVTKLKNNNYKKIIVSLSSASGGHSGEDINLGRINPVRTLLTELYKIKNIKIACIKGGEKFNSIPREAEAEIFVPKQDEIKIVKKLAENLSKIKKAHSVSDPNLKINITVKEGPVSPETRILEKSFQDKLLRISGKEMRVGLISTYDNGDPKTSQNLAIINLKDGILYLAVSSRSSDKEEGQKLKIEITGQLSKLLNKSVVHISSSPLWQKKEDSDLLQTAVKAYYDLHGENPIVHTTHGGLENAVFADKCPGLEQISIGPDIFDPHTTQERVGIYSVEKFYNYIRHLLKFVK